MKNIKLQMGTFFCLGELRFVLWKWRRNVFGTGIFFLVLGIFFVVKIGILVLKSGF